MWITFEGATGTTAFSNKRGQHEDIQGGVGDINSYNVFHFIKKDVVPVVLYDTSMVFYGIIINYSLLVNLV